MTTTNSYFAAKYGLLVAGNLIVAGNGQINCVANLNLTGSTNISGNINLNTGTLILNTTTVNSTIYTGTANNSNNLGGQNSSYYSNVTAPIFSTSIGIGSNLLINASSIVIGGTTINATNFQGTSNNSTYFNGLNVAYFSNTTTINLANSITIGNSSINLTSNSSSLVISNSTLSTTISPLTSNYFVPVGGIIMWSGQVNTIPTGWGLCNGSTYNLLGGGTITSPNLVDKFIIAAGNAYGVGATGGNSNVTLSGLNLPTHSHGITDPGHAHSVYDPSHTHGYNISTSSGAWAGVILVNSTSSQDKYGYESGGYGTEAGFSIQYSGTGIGIYGATTGIPGTQNSGSSAPFSILPPYYALAYIIKL